jgi:hypothetical protein
MPLPISHQGALEDALAYISRTQQYKSTQADTGIRADYDKIWMENFEYMIARYGNYWATKTTTVQQNADLVAQYGDGWARLPADWVRFEPDTFRGDINQTNIGERIAKIAGQTFTYVYIPEVIDNLPVEMMEAIKWRFLAQIGLRDAALTEKYSALYEKSNRATATLTGKITIEAQKRRNQGKGRGMWRNSFL